MKRASAPFLARVLDNGAIKLYGEILIMVMTAILIIVAWVFVLISEIFKSNGFYKATLLFRVWAMLYALFIMPMSQLFPQELPVSSKALPMFALVGAYSWTMFMIELFTQQKIYKSFLDVPRQVLYKMGSHGKCIVLTEKQAKKAHKNGETVYIHAVARVVYKPKDEESPTVGMDKGIGKDWSAVVGKDGKPIVAPQHPVLSEDILKKLKDVQAQIEKRKGMQR